MTNKKAIANLNHIYGMVAPDIQRSLDVAIKALERPQGEWIAISPYTHETFCPYCKEDSKDERYGNFCPNCGADMQIKENKK